MEIIESDDRLKALFIAFCAAPRQFAIAESRTAPGAPPSRRRSLNRALPANVVRLCPMVFGQHPTRATLSNTRRPSPASL